MKDLESCRRRVRELEEILAERDLHAAADAKEVARLAHAFQPARISAWSWAAEDRLTQYPSCPWGRARRPGQERQPGRT